MERVFDNRYSPMTSILKMLLITKTKSLKPSSSDSVFCKVRRKKNGVTDHAKSKYTEKCRGFSCNFKPETHTCMRFVACSVFSHQQIEIRSDAKIPIPTYIYGEGFSPFTYNSWRT